MSCVCYLIIFFISFRYAIVSRCLCNCVGVPVVSMLAGLFALLLIVLEWTRPGLPSPLRPICDLRVLNHFIQEARDAEVAMVRGECLHALGSESRGNVSAQSRSVLLGILGWMPLNGVIVSPFLEIM